MFIVEERLEVNRMIRVFFLLLNIIEELICDFFENVKRSGGGDVEDVFYDEVNNIVIIIF